MNKTVAGSLVLFVEPRKAAHVSDVCRELQALSDFLGREVATEFNQVPLLASPGGSADAVLATWWALMAAACPARPGAGRS